MIYYSLMIFVPTLCFFLNEKYMPEKKYLNICGLIFLIILVTFRNHIGIDFETYGRYFLDIKNGGLMTDSFDYGYVFINSLFAKSGFGFNALLFVIASFNVFAFNKCLDKYLIRNKWIALFIYLGMFDIFVYSLSAIRQSITISFYFLVLINLEDKKFLKSLILFILGYLFHWSMILMLPILVLFTYKRKIKVLYLLIITVIFPFIYTILLKSPLINYMANYNYNMEYYLLINKDSVTNSIYLGIFYMIIGIIWILLVTVIKEVDNWKIILKKRFVLEKVYLDCFQWSLILFLISKSCLAFQYNSAFPRLQMFLYFMLPLAVTNQLEKVSKKGKILLMVALVMIISFSFVSNIKENESSYGNPTFEIYK